MKVKTKQKLKQIGIKLVALTLLMMMLMMYPAQSTAFEEYFKKKFSEEKVESEDGEEADGSSWGNVFTSPRPIQTKFDGSSNPGVAIESATGSPILAPSSGTVTKSEWSDTNNYILEVQREDGKSWTVKNLLSSPLPKVGDKVMMGQEVAYVGTVPLLLIEVRDGDELIDPETIIDFSATGVSRGAFRSGGKNNLLMTDYRKTIYDGEFFYRGIPEGHFTKSRFNFWKWIVNFLFEIVDYLLGLVASVFTLGVLGWVILVEVLLTDAFDSLTVKNVGSGTYRKNNVGFYTDSKRTVNVENLLFNRVEALNVNFFESKESVKQRLLKYSPTGLAVEDLYGEEYEEELAELEDGPLLIIKDYFALIFLILYAVALLLLLVGLMLNAILAAVESVAMKKATYKKRARSWTKAFVEMLLLLVYMIVILQVHTWVIDFLSKYADAAVENLGGAYIQTDMGRNYTIMETLRTRAYSIKLTVGVPATIMYTVLIWYTFKFVLMYTKRFLVVFFLSLLGPILMVYDLIIRTVKGQSTVRIDWIKEYTFNVLIQVIHAFVYLIFVPITYALASTSIIGFIIMFILLKFLLEADKLIRQVFDIRGSKKHSTLDNVLEKSTFKDYASGFAVGSLLGRKGIVGRATRKVSSAIIKPIKATAGMVGATAVRGTFNLKEYAGEVRRSRRVQAGKPIESAGQIRRTLRKDRQVEEILKLQGYSEGEIKERMDPKGKLALTEEQKDRIRLLERSKVMKTNKIISGINKTKYTSNRFKRVLKDMSEVDGEGRRRIKGRNYYFDYDEKKIKLTPGLHDKFKKSVIKEFKMGEGALGQEEYRQTVADFKKAGTLGLKAVAGLLFFPISFADSDVPTSLYFGLLGNFQFNSKAMQRERGRASVVKTSPETGKLSLSTKRESKALNKVYRKTNKEIYKKNIKNAPLKSPKANTPQLNTSNTSKGKTQKKITKPNQPKT